MQEGYGYPWRSRVEPGHGEDTFRELVHQHICRMNMRSGLEDSPTWVFWAVFLAGILVGAVVREWVLGRLLRQLENIKDLIG
jgi:hypothetical protein